MKKQISEHDLRTVVSETLREAIIKISLSDGSTEHYQVRDDEIEKLRSFFTNDDTGLGRQQFSASTYKSDTADRIVARRNSLVKKLEKQGLGETNPDGTPTERSLKAQEELNTFNQEMISGVSEEIVSGIMPELTSWIESAGASQDKVDAFFTRLAEIYLEGGESGFFMNTVDRIVSPSEASLDDFFTYEDPSSAGVTEITLNNPSLIGVSNLNTVSGGGSKAQEMGKGELAVPFMFRDSHWASGNAIYDNNIGPTGWHLKEMPQKAYAGGKSIRLGKQGYAGSEVQVFLTSVSGMSASALGAGAAAKGKERKASLLKNMSKIVDAMRNGTGGYFSLSDDEVQAQLSHPAARGMDSRAAAIAATKKIQDRLNEEMLSRSINLDGAAGGVCYFVPETSTFHFHGLDSVGCAGATQGSHRVSGRTTPIFDSVIANIHMADFHEVDEKEETAMIKSLSGQLLAKMGESLKAISVPLERMGFSKSKSSPDFSMKIAKKYAEDPELDIRTLARGANLSRSLAEIDDQTLETFSAEVQSHVIDYRANKNKKGIITPASNYKVWRRSGRDISDLAEDERWAADDIQSDAAEILGSKFLG